MSLKEIFRRLNTPGAVFPYQMAFTLLFPLRGLILSPRELVRRLAPAPACRILEVGCGPGYFSPALARAVPQGRLVLADIQPQMLAAAEKRLRRRHIANADTYLCGGQNFDGLPDGAFDRIVLVTVLGEIAERESYLREFARLLAPDGLLSVSEAAGDADKISREDLTALMAAHGFVLHSSFGSRRNFTLNFMRARTENKAV